VGIPCHDTRRYPAQSKAVEQTALFFLALSMPTGYSERHLKFEKQPPFTSLPFVNVRKGIV